MTITITFLFKTKQLYAFDQTSIQICKESFSSVKLFLLHHKINYSNLIIKVVDSVI